MTRQAAGQCMAYSRPPVSVTAGREGAPFALSLGFLIYKMSYLNTGQSRVVKSHTTGQYHRTTLEPSFPTLNFFFVVLGFELRPVLVRQALCHLQPFWP
jgi:hypothetical protein